MRALPRPLSTTRSPEGEFYRLYGFFNNVNEVGQIPYSGVPSPTAIVTTPEVDARLAELAEQIGRSKPSSIRTARFEDEFEAWVANGRQPSRRRRPAPPVSPTSRSTRSMI